MVADLEGGLEDEIELGERERRREGDLSVGWEGKV